MPTGTVKWFNATKGMGSSFPTMGARTRSSTSPPSSAGRPQGTPRRPEAWIRTGGRPQRQGSRRQYRRPRL